MRSRPGHQPARSRSWIRHDDVPARRVPLERSTAARLRCRRVRVGWVRLRPVASESARRSRVRPAQPAGRHRQLRCRVAYLPLQHGKRRPLCQIRVCPCARSESGLVPDPSPLLPDRLREILTWHNGWHGPSGILLSQSIRVNPSLSESIRALSADGLSIRGKPALRRSAHPSLEHSCIRVHVSESWCPKPLIRVLYPSPLSESFIRVPVSVSKIFVSESEMHGTRGTWPGVPPGKVGLDPIRRFRLPWSRAFRVE